MTHIILLLVLQLLHPFKYDILLYLYASWQQLSLGYQTDSYLYIW